MQKKYISNQLKRSLVCLLFITLAAAFNAVAHAQTGNESDAEPFDFDSIPDIETDGNTQTQAPETIEDETNEVASERPHWSFELKAGRFEPVIEDWATYYGKDYTSTAGLSLSYKIWRQFEVGIGIDGIRDSGQGYLPINDILGGEVKYKLYPTHVYVLYRGVFSENQWIVPYIGGGFTRVAYEQDVVNQPSVEGDTDGAHLRGGVQFLLDFVDPGNSVAISEDAGVFNTYFTIEYQNFEAEIDGIDLGGDSVTVGFLFEF